MFEFPLSPLSITLLASESKHDIPGGDTYLLRVNPPVLRPRIGPIPAIRTLLKRLQKHSGLRVTLRLLRLLDDLQLRNVSVSGPLTAHIYLIGVSPPIAELARWLRPLRSGRKVGTVETMVVTMNATDAIDWVAKDWNGHDVDRHNDGMYVQFWSGSLNDEMSNEEFLNHTEEIRFEMEDG